MKKTLTLMICGALFLFVGCFKCNAKPLTVCLHTVNGDTHFDCNNLSESSPISDVLLSFCNIGSVEFYFKNHYLWDHCKTLGEYQIHEGTIDIWASKGFFDQSITYSDTNEKFRLRSNPLTEIHTYRLFNEMQNGYVTKFDPLETVEIKLCIHDASAGDLATRVVAKYGDTIADLLPLFNKDYVLFVRDGRLLNPRSKFGSLGFKEGNTIHVLSFDPNDSVKPAVPINWISVSSLSDRTKSQLISGHCLKSEIDRLSDIRIKNSMFESSHVTDLENVKHLKANYQNDVQKTIIPPPSSQMSEDPLPVEWGWTPESLS